MFGQRYDMSRFRPAPTVQGQVIVADSVGTALKWKPGTLSDLGGVEEAPSDTVQYVRENGAWVAAPTKHELLGYSEYVARFEHDGDTIMPTVIEIDTSLTVGTWTRGSNGTYFVAVAGATTSNTGCFVTATSMSSDQTPIIGCDVVSGFVYIYVNSVVTGNPIELNIDGGINVLIRKYD